MFSAESLRKKNIKYIKNRMKNHAESGEENIKIYDVGLDMLNCISAYFRCRGFNVSAKKEDSGNYDVIID